MENPEIRDNEVAVQDLRAATLCGKLRNLLRKCFQRLPIPRHA